MLLVWNARGAAGKEFKQTLIELRERHKAQIVVLVETRCSGVSAQKAIKSLGFRHKIIEEARGMSGGIWILWNDDGIRLHVIETNKQFIHCRVTRMGRHDWLFTEVYGSPRESERVELWEAMSGLAEDNN